MTSSAKITVSDYDSLLVDFNGFRLMIDAGENPLDWQKIVSKVDALLVPAPTGNATNNAWRGVEMSDMPIISSALPKHLLKQLEDKNIAFITCHQSEKYEPVVLYKHLNEQVELYVLDGGQKLAHDSLQKAVEKEDPAAIEQAALKYGLIAALVWYPPKKDEPIKRILYTGNASYERVISALEKASSLTIFQYPVVTASMLPLKPLLTRNRVTSTIAADSRTRPSVPRIAATVNKPISEKNASRMARPKANLPSNTVKDGFKVPTLPAPSRPNPINRKLFSKGNSSAMIRAQPNTAKSLKPVKNVPVEKPCEKQSDQRQPPKNILPVAPSDIVPDKVPEIITLDDTMMNGVPETAQECTPSLDVENMPTETDEKCRDITGEQAPPMSDETLDFFSPQGNESIKVTESPSSLENSTTSEDTNRGSEDNGGDDMRLINISPYHRSVTKISMSPNSSLISPDVLEDIKTADASIAGATIDVLHDMINKLSHENDGFVSANFNQLPNSRMHMAVTKVKPVLKNSRYFEAVFLPHSVAGVCNVDNLGDAGEFFSSVRSSMYIASGRELPGCLIPSWFAGKKSWKKPDTASVLCLTKSPNCVEMNEEEMLGEHCDITFTQNSTYTL